jgi:hypothetical protein
MEPDMMLAPMFLALALSATAPAAEIPEPVYRAARAAADAIYHKRNACVLGADAAVASWVASGPGRTGRRLEIPELRGRPCRRKHAGQACRGHLLREGHALAWLEQISYPGGWYVDPVGSDTNWHRQVRLERVRSPEVAVSRWKIRPDPSPPAWWAD